MIAATNVTQAEEIAALAKWLGKIKLSSCVMKLRHRNGDGA
jgi:hypothetical protein